MTVTSSYFSSPFLYDSIFSISTATPSQKDWEFVNELFSELDQKTGGLFSLNLEQHKVAPKPSISALHSPPSLTSAKIHPIQHPSPSKSSIPTLQAPLLPFTSDKLDLSSTTLKTQRITRKRKALSSTKQTHTCKDCNRIKTVKRWRKINNTDYRCYTCHNKTLPCYSKATHTCNTCKNTKTVRHWQQIGDTEWRCHFCYRKTMPSHAKATHKCNYCNKTKTVTLWKQIGNTGWRCNACYQRANRSRSQATHKCNYCNQTKTATTWKQISSTVWRCYTCYLKTLPSISK